MKKILLYTASAILLGAILGVAFFYLTNPPRPKVKAEPTPTMVMPTVSMTSSPSASRSASPSARVRSLGASPQEVTQNYYAAYQNCLQNPPAQAQGTVSQYCQKNNKYVANNFSANTQGIDPVLCSQNPPQSVRIDRQTITNDTASTYAIISTGGTDKQILVHLSSETGEWKITGIICPRN